MTRRSVRAGIMHILSPADGFEVVAECEDGCQIIELVTETVPDIVLMDIRMPGMDGIAATRQSQTLNEPPAVLVLTTFGEDEVLWGAVEAGAAGFILKDTSAEDLLAAARAVAAGGAWFDPAVTPRILSAYRSSLAPRKRCAASRLADHWPRRART